MLYIPLARDITITYIHISHLCIPLYYKATTIPTSVSDPPPTLFLDSWVFQHPTLLHMHNAMPTYADTADTLWWMPLSRKQYVSFISSLNLSILV